MIGYAYVARGRPMDGAEDPGRRILPPDMRDDYDASQDAATDADNVRLRGPFPATTVLPESARGRRVSSCCPEWVQQRSSKLTICLCLLLVPAIATLMCVAPVPRDACPPFTQWRACAATCR